MSAKRAGAADREIGRRIRVYRLARRITQVALADHLGISFQQIQKYERGVNRVSASRLKKVAAFLEVDFATLANSKAGDDLPALEFASRSRETVELIQLWDKVSSDVKAAILALARAAAAGK